MLSVGILLYVSICGQIYQNEIAIIREPQSVTLRNESLSLQGPIELQETKDYEGFTFKKTLHTGCLWENVKYWTKCLGMRRVQMFP